MSSASETSFFAELKRRKVVRVAIAYAGVAAAMLETAERTFSVFAIDANITRVMVVSAVAGLPVVLVLSWLFDLTSRGVVKTSADGEVPTGDIGGPQLGRFTWQLLVASALVVVVMSGAGWRYLPNDRVDFVENRVVVAEFVDETGDPELAIHGSIVAREITRGLHRIQGLDVVPLSDVGLPGATNVDLPGRSRAQALAERERAALVITGSYYLAGEDLVIRADVYDARDERVIYPAEPVRGDREDPTPGVALLQEGLFGFLAGLGGGGPFVEASSVRAQSRPPPYAAYKQYALALELLKTSFFERDAQLAHLDSAMSLDSTFVAAMAMSSLLRMRSRDVSGARLILERMENLRADLTSYERAGLDLLQARVAGDLSGVYRFSNEIADLVGTSMSHFQAGQAALRVNRPKEARAHFDEYDDVRMRHREIYQSRAVANHLLGRHRTEMRIVRQARERIPVDRAWAFRRWELAAFAARGEWERLMEDLDGFDLGGINARIVLGVADELEVHGHSERAHALRELLLVREEALVEEERGRTYLHDRGNVLSSLGRHDEARVLFQSLIEANPENGEFRVDAALAASKTGDRAYAEQTVEWLGERMEQQERGGNTLGQARIAAALGDAERAVRLLEQAEAYGQTDFRELHVHPAYAPIRDHPTFKAYQQPRG